MASLCPLDLRFLSLVTIYFVFAVSAETTLGANCTDSIQCIDSNSACILKKCRCKDDSYKDSISGCTLRNHPNSRCGNYSPKSESCVTNACCNASDFCVCCKTYTATSNSCIQAPLSAGSSSLAVQTITPKSMQDTSRNPTGVEVFNSSGSTVQTTDFNTTIGNSAVTMDVVENSTLIMCFVLAYLKVLK